MDNRSARFPRAARSHTVIRGRYRLLATITFVGLAWASGCGDGGTEPPPPDPPRPATVTVSPATAELTALGATAQLAAQVLDQYGQVMANANVSWSTSAAQVAAVDGSGLVTAAGNGAATITATAGSASGTAAVTVRQEVSAVAISPAAGTVVERDTLRLVAEATDANGHVMAEAEFAWASGDDEVAMVDATGLVTGVGAGEVEVTASASGVVGRAELLVEAPVATTVTVAPDTLDLTALADTMRLTAEVRDQIGRVMEDEPVAWTSGDTMSVTVDAAGLVAAVDNGSATITATADEASGHALVRVMQSAGSVVISPAVRTIAPGDTLRFAAEAYDRNGHRVEGADFTWSSSEVTVATVDGSGVARGVAEGEATITATADNVQGTAELTVTNPDRAALVALYEATDGPNWVNNEGWLSDAPLDEWYGVGTDGFGRVFSLDLQGQWDEEQREWIHHGLRGPIPAELGSLTNLRYLWLSTNALTGGIPPELGKLVDLRTLDLGSNALTGPIPAELGGLASLQRLQLYHNELTGSIPAELGGLAALRSLSLGRNELTGSIPAELGSLSNLEWLDAGDNSMTGPIPAELGGLAALRSLSLGGNELTGSIPAELGSLSNLERLYLAWNALSGPMPRSLLRLGSLTRLYFSANNGLCAPGTAAFATWLEAIERSDGPFCNAADREALELLFLTSGGDGWTQSEGWRTTPVLAEWHGVDADSLGRVVRLDLTRNGLEGELTPAIGNLTAMIGLRLGGNALSGRLPLSLANLPLVEFYYDDTELCAPTEESFREWLNSIASHRGTGLECLSVRSVLKTFYEATDGPNWVNSDGWLSDAPLEEWYGVDIDGFGRVVGLDLGGRWDRERREWIPHGLRGSIPAELGTLTSLRDLRLNNNALTGGIPPELGNLVDLRRLYLGSNALTGSIPAELAGLSRLQGLQLGNNKLTGSIPPELGSLANLAWLNLGGNALTGSIPAELANLSSLQDLYFYDNEFTGSIPGELGSLPNLQWLDIGGNSLTGPIPAELGSLATLRSLGLAGNELTGSIPAELGSLANLERLYVSRNELSGPIPRSFVQLGNLTRLYFQSNDGLCAPGTAPFATWIEGLERSAGPFCNEADREALELLFETAGGNGWTRSDGWLETQALEEWHGVTADSLGLVTALDLGNNELSGKLPSWAREALAHLTELRIGENAALAGRLPLSLANLPLRVLHYAGTGVCAPTDEAFARWLNSIASHEGTGLECAPLTDREILEIVYGATGGADWTNSGNWLTNRPLREWHGVYVDSRGRVVGLELFANRLNGTIPAELGKLTELRRLVIARNYGGLTGPIPAELGNLANLERMYLYSNGLEGAIPPELGSLPSLETLSLLSNNLEGEIPRELGNLASLGGLFLHDNNLEGTIPPELGNLANLRYLFLAGNRLTGSIPAALGRLGRLRDLSLVRNGLTGSVPGALGQLRELETLYAGHNQLMGPVPQEFGGLTRLRSLALSGNAEMSGALPSSLTGLRSMEILEASGTQLCAPSDPRFLEWLDRLPNPRVALCGGEPALAYLVQPVQSRQFPVSLVAGEEALLRVFVTAAEDNEERLPPVRASFHLGGALAHVADIAGKAGPIPTEVDEGSLAKSANAVIPGEVVRPGLEVVIEIDPDGTLDPGLGVVTRIPETGRMPVDVSEVPFFNLTVIPFLWRSDPDSAILEHTQGMAADPEGHELLEMARILLPIAGLDVSAHEPVFSSSNDAYAIFGETVAIRRLEGGTDYYMGMMSGPVTGAGGLGSVGGPFSFSVPGSGVIAHELGHNMSLSHAPCGGAAGPDQAFPYLDGATGAWGYDSRGGGRLLGPEAKDLMGYCGPYWISDFHLAKALDFRLNVEKEVTAAAAAGPVKSLLLWGGTDSTGTPSLEPAFVVDAPPALPASGGDYTITGRDGAGGQLFSLSFAMLEQPDGNGSSSFAFVLPVDPAWAGVLSSITLAGPGGSVTLDADSEQPMAILRNPRTGQVRGFLRDLPTRIEAVMDLAGQAAGPGLEVFFSRGIPGAEAWTR